MDFDPDAYLAQAQAPTQAPAQEAEKSYAVGETGDFDPDSYLKNAAQEAHGSGTEQLKTAAEGLAQGVAGPLATMAETKVLGVNPEDIAGRAEANPGIHGISEGAGLIGGSFIPGVGEYTIGAKIAQAGKIAELANIGKIGTAAIKGAIEGGLFQASDEASKYILGQSDPEAPVSSALAHIGAAGLFGGFAGGTLGKLGSKLQDISEGKISSKASQFLSDFGSRFKFLQDNPELGSASAEQAQHLLDTVSMATEGAFSLKRNSIEKLTSAIAPEVTSAYVNSTLSTLENAPKSLSQSELFQDALQNWKSKVFPKADEMAGGNSYTPTAADVFEATDDLKRTLQHWAKFEKRITNPAELPFVQKAAQMAHHIRTSLENPGAWGEMAGFQKELNGAYSKILTPLKDFTKTATQKVGDEVRVDPDKLFNLFRQLGKGKGELRGEKVANFFEPAQKFLQAVDELHTSQGLESNIPKVSTHILDEMLRGELPKGAQMANWLFGAGPKSIGMAAGHAAGTVAGGVTGHPYLGYRAGEHLAPMFAEGIGRKLTRWGVDGALRAMSAGDPQGIPEAIHYAEAIGNGTKRIDSAISNLFKVGGSRYLNHEFSEKDREAVKKYIESGVLNQQINNKQSPPKEEQNFAHGGEVAPRPVQPTTKDVGGPLKGIDRISSVYPEQAMLLGSAKGRINNYLNQKRPQTITSRLPFDEHVPDKQKERSYDKAIDIANKPLSVLDHIKNGTLDSDHVEGINGMYPELSNHLRKKLTEAVTKAQMDEEKPSYKVRQGLSLFMGAALDSNLTAQNIMAAQQTFFQQKNNQQAAAQPMKPKKGTGSLENAPDQYRTSSQASQLRQNRPK